MMDSVRVRLDEGAYMPVRGHEEDAGLDLRSPEPLYIRSRQSVVVDTGVHLMIPRGYCGLLVSKSGLYVNCACTTTGLIDACFTGSIRVRVVNDSYSDVTIDDGDKFTQVVFLRCETPTLELDVVQSHGLRGDDGYGSTGR